MTTPRCDTEWPFLPFCTATAMDFLGKRKRNVNVSCITPVRNRSIRRQEIKPEVSAFLFYMMIQHGLKLDLCDKNNLQINNDSAGYTHWPNVGPTNDSQRIQAANDSADYTHWPKGGPTHDSKRIQAAYDSADYIHLPNVGPTHDSQRLQAACDSADYIHWPKVGPTDLANVFYTSSDSVDNISWPNVGSAL